MDSTLLIVLIAVYVVLNLISMFMFFSDKRKAVKNKWRTTENALLTSAFFGPFGATLGMHLAHHKTNKPKFKLVYLFLILHIVIIAILIIIPF